MARPGSQIGAAACRFVYALSLFALLAAASGMARAQSKPQKAKTPSSEGPTDPKARKTFAEAADWSRQGYRSVALDDFRKANKQDGGHCGLCLERAFKLAQEIGDYKSAEGVARDWLASAETDDDRILNHYRLAMALQWEGTAKEGPVLQRQLR
jgi:hypothetical protein